jgi:cytidine deaminase
MAVAQAIEAALAEDLQALHAAAEEARGRSHAPYSGFHVGAALLTRDGHTITGGNVENASYGLTICAERAAIFRALAEGHANFVAVAVAGPADTVSPCGACRQVLAEFLDPGAVVVFPLDARLVAVPLGDLLPHAFGPSDVLSGS